MKARRAMGIAAVVAFAMLGAARADEVGDDDPVDASAPAAAVTVEQLHAALLANMQQRLSCAARIDRLHPVVVRSFDFPFLTRYVVKKHWETLSEEQRTALQAALGEFTVANYGANFAHFSGEKFTTLETRKVARGNQQVRARLDLPKGDPVVFDYVLRPAAQGEWRVINVIVNGVSDVALRSAQYERLMNERGYAGLLAWVQQQTAQIKDNCGGKTGDS